MIDYRQTYRTLQRALDRIEESAETTRTLSGILGAIVQGPGPSLGITGGRLWRRHDDDGTYVLEATSGEPATLQPGITLPQDYLPIRRLREEGLVFAEDGDDDFDRRVEGQLGITRFAAIAVGEEARHIVAFTLAEHVDPQQAVLLLGSIRHVVNLRMATGHLIQDVAEARRIQLSMLPARAPEFHGFDIAARTLPAEEVGGDVYDFPLISPDTLGVMVADSSGHGLPAALMARDVVTGMRVALDAHYRAVRAIEKVNRVVSRAALSSKFISMLYVELDVTGTMMFCNAGHPPGLLWRDGKVIRLASSGLVLGVDANATYRRHFENFAPGSMLALYSDGISEAESRRGRFFGVEGLEKMLRGHHALSAEAFVDVVFEVLGKHAPGARQDDQTLMVIKRPQIA